MKCPKCDAELEVQEAEPDVGIMLQGRTATPATCVWMSSTNTTMTT